MSHHRVSIAAPLTVLSGAALCMSLAVAEEMTSFATGGFAHGLRTMSEMHKIDTDADGNVSKAEWLAYQEKVFDMMDKNHTGKLGPQEFLGKPRE